MNFEVDKDFSLLYGIMLGDGCLSLVNRKKKFISIKGSLKDDLPFFENIISPILMKLRNKNTNIKIRKFENSIEFNFIDNNLFDLIHSFGFPIGKKGNRLFIPKIFYDKHLVNYIISGFFATDGSIVLTRNPNKYYPRLEAHIIAHDLVKEIYDFLIALGFKGHFYKCKRKIRDLRWKIVQDQYRFQFNGKRNLILFSEKIGFVNPKYQEKFKEFLEYDKKYNNAIKGISYSKLKIIRKPINSEFMRKMAVPGVEPGTPSS